MLDINCSQNVLPTSHSSNLMYYMEETSGWKYLCKIKKQSNAQKNTIDYYLDKQTFPT